MASGGEMRQDAVGNGWVGEKMDARGKGRCYTRGEREATEPLSAAEQRGSTAFGMGAWMEGGEERMDGWMDAGGPRVLGRSGRGRW